MKNQQSIVATSLAAVLVCAALAASADENLEVAMPGARARAMGGAYTAIADDLSAVYWNPAGLAAIDGGTAQADTRLAWGGGATTSNLENVPTQVGETPIIDFTDKLNTRTTYYLLGAVASLPFQSMQRWKPVGAVSFRRMVDNLYAEGQVITIDVGGDTRIPLEHLDEGDGGIDALTLSLAMQPHERIRVGGNVNILTGTLENSIDDNVTFSGLTIFHFRNSTTQDVSGWSVELGVQAQLHERIDVGAVIRPGYDMTLNNRVLDLLAFQASGGIGLPPIDVEDTIDLNNIEAKVPTFYSIGAAIRPDDNSVLTVDYLHRPWDELEQFELGSRGPVLLRNNAYATNVVTFGGEYVFKRDTVEIPVRGGFHLTPTTRAKVDSLSASVDNQGFRTYDGERVEGSTWSLGVGVHFATVDFDLALDRTSVDQVDFLQDARPVPGQPLFTVAIDRNTTSLYISSTLHF